MRRASLFCLASACVGVTAMGFVACGSRTGLELPLGEAPVDATPDLFVADVVHKVPFEAAVEAGVDAPPEVGFRDVSPIDLCPDAGSTLIYVLTQQNDLYSFYPPSLTFTLIGTIECPNTAAQPFSMGVDRRGIAYSIFQDGNLFRIDTASAACLGTPYVPDSGGFSTFGMGFVANTGDAGETLYIADAVLSNAKPNSAGLGSIDTIKYAASFVAPFSPPIPGPELTGTADGRLFAFYTNAAGSGSHIVEVDKTTGVISTDYALQVGLPTDAYAFGFWGGVFWVFTAASTGPSTVTRFDPVTQTETNVATMPQTIVGAGVSTCAPE